MAPYCLRQLTEAVSISQSAEADISGGSSAEEDLDDIASLFPNTPNVFPESLQLENSLPKLLMNQCGVSDIHQLFDETKVKLKVISKEMSLQRLSIYMPSLVELDLSGSWLLSLRDLGCGLKIKVLRVASCGLECLDGLFGLTTLKELHAPSNSIVDIGSCAILPRLQLLDLGRNRVNNLGEISFLTICTQLKDLDLSECPVSDYEEYRDVVLELLPGLTRLNGEMIALEKKKNNLGEIEETEEKETCFDKKNSDKDKDLQDEQKLLENVKTGNPTISFAKNKRPLSSLGVRAVSSCTGRLQRPHTALPANKKSQTPEYIHENPVTDIVNDNEEDTASRLTSGVIVCGNLTAALRSQRRKNKDPSGVKETEDDKNDLISIINKGNEKLLRIKRSVSPPPDIQSTTANDADNKEKINEKIDRAKKITELLEASRRWREAYSKYRHTKREKWNQENSERKERKPYREEENGENVYDDYDDDDSEN